jgi:hypothetical protein
MRSTTACVSGSPHVVLEDVGVLPVPEDETHEEHAAKRPALVRHALERRLHDVGEDVGGRSRVQEDGRAVRSHPARVRAPVAVEDPLVVHRGRERQRPLAVAQDHEAHLVARDVALDEDPVGRRAEDVVVEEELQRALGFLRLVRHDDALAGREAVRLEHARHAERLERLLRLAARLADLGVRRRDAVLLHEELREDLRALELGGEPVRPEGRQPPARELVHEAERERQLRPDDGQVDLHRLREVRQLDHVLDADREAGRERGHAGVPRRGEDVRDARRLGQLPHERVLAAP